MSALYKEKSKNLLKLLLEAEHVDVKDLVAHFAINQVLVMILNKKIYIIFAQIHL